MALALHTLLSFSKTLTTHPQLFLSHKTPPPHLSTAKPTFIRMGGGPRTYPGGVSKWQWKRMQAKKAKQLLKARLARERQIYEMRKRAELKAAVSELERPWEVVEKPPNLFSASADEQVKVLADRFQKPGGFDMWSEKDGPQLFQTPDGIPSARFFPKGVVHSVKPYGSVSGLGHPDGDSGSESGIDEDGDLGSENEGSLEEQISTRRLPDRGRRRRSVRSGGGEGGLKMKGGGMRGMEGRVGGRRKFRSNGDGRVDRSGGRPSLGDSKSEVYDMSLRPDGSYGF